MTSLFEVVEMLEKQIKTLKIQNELLKIQLNQVRQVNDYLEAMLEKDQHEN